jgi:hypothetical protein
MLITAAGATLNVTYVDKIIVDKDANGWLCRIVYEDGKGRSTTYTWSGGDSMQSATQVHLELLKQIKEVELEKMSMLLENAINNVNQS